MSDQRAVRADLPAARTDGPLPRAVWAAAIVIALGAFLGNMDSSVVAVGLDAMRHGLGASLAEIQWVATAYLLGLSAALPLTPWLTRRLGSGRLWLGMLVAFVLTSAAAALAPTAVALIAVRAVQGMTAGVLVATGQTVLGEAVGPARLGRMMGVLGLVVGLAPIVGPSVGGLLLARFAWPALFWLNLPIGALTWLLGLRFVPRGQRRAAPPIDWFGLVLVSLGLPLLVYALTDLGTPGRADTAADLGLAVLGLAAVLAFGWWSRRRRHPVLRLRLAAHPLMAASLASVLLGAAGMFGAVLLLPLWFQLARHAGSAATGLLLVPLGVGGMIFVTVAGRLTDRYGGGTVALAGSLVVLASTAPWPWLGAGTPMVLVQALLFVRGAGVGLTLMPATTAAYAAVRPADLGDATALANIVMRVGGAVGGALCVIVLSRGLAAGPTDPAAAFPAAFVALTALAVLATVATAWLRHAERAERAVQHEQPELASPDLTV